MTTRRPRAVVALLAALLMALTACAVTQNGTGRVGMAGNAQLDVVGGTDQEFDTNAKNALSDIIAFWQINYPKISNGDPLPKIKGGFYSVDGGKAFEDERIEGPAAKNGCLQKDPTGIVDNAFYCEVDDSIAWDRDPNHLLGAIGSHVPDDAGNLLIALAFAHEFGHAIQQRLNIFDKDLKTIQTESQADCAAGAWLATVMKNQNSHYTNVSEQQIDDVLTAYLLVRDKTPDSSTSGSHGNGFDRISAVADGLSKGVSYCYSESYFSRQFTERPFTTDSDYASGGNECFDQVINPAPPTGQAGCVGGGGLQPSLNDFWTKAAKIVKKSWKNVSIKAVDSPSCAGQKGSSFLYCPSDNTVYFSTSYAKSVYYSIESLQIDKSNADVRILTNQPGDYALGEMFAIAWGLAVRHQLFGESTDDGTALLAATCYSGAYAKSINVPQTNATPFVLSPPDLDEATYAVMQSVPQDDSYGARGTTGTARVQQFVKGYNSGLSGC